MLLPNSHQPDCVASGLYYRPIVHNKSKKINRTNQIPLYEF